MAESETVSLIRAAYEAFNRGELEGALTYAHPEFEFRRPEGGPYKGGTVRGREAMLAFLAPDAFDQQRATPLEFTDKGDVVLVRLSAYARGASSGIELEQEVFHVWRIEDGRARRLEVYTERNAASEAAGIEP
jgi:ketosteroid isomerase-like protein